MGNPNEMKSHNVATKDPISDGAGICRIKEFLPRYLSELLVDEDLDLKAVFTCPKGQLIQRIFINSILV